MKRWLSAILIVAILSLSSISVLAIGLNTSAYSERLVAVSEGTSVTVYEMTGWLLSYTFPVSDLMNGGGTFVTPAMMTEEYTVTSDGTYVKIQCYRLEPYPCPGISSGNNIVAVSLNGVPGYPDGIWASVIVSYIVGSGGIEESRFNALGSVDDLGPYMNSPCTYLGNDNSEIVLGFTVGETELIEATVDVKPDVLNLADNGNWVTAYIELPAGYDLNDIVLDSITLNGEVQAAPSPSCIGDYDKDGVPDLMVKFDRQEVIAILQLGSIDVTIAGELADGTSFEGNDSLMVINPVPSRSNVMESRSILTGEISV